MSTSESWSLEDQMAAAVTVSPAKAARLLGFYNPENLNGVPKEGEFRMRFTFTPSQLHAFIRGHGLEDEIIGISLDNRGVPAAYVEPADDAFNVGWFDSVRREERKIRSKTDAVTEYVLLSWGMPPLDAASHPGRSSVEDWPGLRTPLSK